MFVYTYSQPLMFSEGAYYAGITIFHTLLLNLQIITYKKEEFKV
jgi:hypothetical protein